MTDRSLLGTWAAIVFVALLVWREARGCSRAAQVAVAGTVLNRVSRPKWWGTTVLAVCFKKLQYSSLTDPHDRQLTTWPVEDDASWQQCLDVADAVLAGREETSMPGADSYFDDSIAPPFWVPSARFVGQIGRLRFYDVDHDYEAAAVAADGGPQ